MSNIIQLKEFDVTQKVIEALSNVCTRAILFCVKDGAKDAGSIADELGISLSATYRTVAVLEEIGLMDVERFVISKDGKKTKMYKSRIGKAEITIQGTEPVLRLYPASV